MESNGMDGNVLRGCVVLLTFPTFGGEKVISRKTRKSYFSALPGLDVAFKKNIY